MKKKQRGFTLVELISVIGIVAILLIIMAPVVTNIAEDSKETLRNSKINTIEVAATRYADDTVNYFQRCVGNTPDIVDCTVKLQELVDMNYLESEESVIDPKTNVKFKGDLLICYDIDTTEVDAHFIENGKPYECDR